MLIANAFAQRYPQTAAVLVHRQSGVCMLILSRAEKQCLFSCMVKDKFVISSWASEGPSLILSLRTEQLSTV